MKSLLKIPLSDLFQLCVVGQIDLNRYDGDVAVVQGPFIRIAGFGFGIVEVSAQPVVVAALRIGSPFELLTPVSPVLTAGHDSLDFGCRQVGNVDVQT